jgi:predicted phage baseplate assembly protein
MATPADRELTDCGCCEGLEVETPVRPGNPPDLPAVACRSGTHSRFFRTMLARLSTSRLAALAGLTTREPDDLSIALLDAWATLADVLTFYNERIANESFVRTATERRSVLELARAIGYQLRPGAAARVMLAFTMDAAPGGVPKTTIPVGTKAQSVPGPGEDAQTFETVEPIEARVGWNGLRPRQFVRHPLPYKTNLLYFDGLSTNLKPGDGVLFRTDDGKAVFGLVAAVTANPSPGKPELRIPPRTEVRLDLLTPVTTADALVTPLTPRSPGPRAEGYLGQTGKPDADLRAEASAGKFVVQELFDALAASPEVPARAIVFRVRAAVFGHNAPEHNTLPTSFIRGEVIQLIDTVNSKLTVPHFIDARFPHWVEDDDLSGSTINLDIVYPAVSRNSIVVLRAGNTWGFYRVTNVTEASVAKYTLSGKATQIALDAAVSGGPFPIRSTTVFAAGEELVLARVPDETAVPADDILLDGWVDGLEPGRAVAVTGESFTTPGTFATECPVIAQVKHDLVRGGGARIFLQTPLTTSFRRETVTINANVAPATHGETKQEVLGSGDGSRPFQRFALKQPPLTHVGAATPSGTESTLKVYVNDVEWREVPALIGHGPKEHVFSTSLDDNGVTTVQFGDGASAGARLPGGAENVRAGYRKGLGLGGLVKAGQISLLLTRPAGVNGVTNALPSDGGDDRERMATARENAPLTVKTLGRVVSLQDFEDFARGFAGIAKASATWVRAGEVRGVMLTVAGPGGREVTEASPVYGFLVDALRQSGDPYVPVRVASFASVFFKLALAVAVEKDHVPERVLAAVETAVRSAFSFDNRRIGQGVTYGEVVAVAQSVPGVVAVTVTELRRSDDPPTPAVRKVLIAAAPTPGADLTTLQPAELLTLHPAPLNPTVFS